MQRMGIVIMDGGIHILTTILVADQFHHYRQKCLPIALILMLHIDHITAEQIVVCIPVKAIEHKANSCVAIHQ